MFSCWQLYDANWIGGNFVFLKEVTLSLWRATNWKISQVPQLEGVDRVLRLVLVTEEKNRAGSHVPGLPNFLLGQEIR